MNKNRHSPANGKRSKLILTPEQRARIDALIAEIRCTPEQQASVDTMLAKLRGTPEQQAKLEAWIKSLREGPSPEGLISKLGEPFRHDCPRKTEKCQNEVKVTQVHRT